MGGGGGQTETNLLPPPSSQTPNPGNSLDSPDMAALLQEVTWWRDASWRAGNHPEEIPHFRWDLSLCPVTPGLIQGTRGTARGRLLTAVLPSAAVKPGVLLLTAMFAKWCSKTR